MTASPSTPTVARPEVRKLLHIIDTDVDELIRLPDLVAYVKNAGLPFSAELLGSMFAEANASGDGQIDEEQLGKAVSGQFPHRKHNDDWLRLFELALPGRITSLSPAPLEREPILANFEQENGILTFSPLTNSAVRPSSRGGGFRSPHSRSGVSTLQGGGTVSVTSTLGGGASLGGGTSRSSYSPGPSERARLRASRTQRLAKPAPQRTIAADRELEDTINRHLLPPGARPMSAARSTALSSVGFNSSKPPTAGSGGASSPVRWHDMFGESADASSMGSTGGGVTRFGFAAVEALKMAEEKMQRESDGVGWRNRRSPLYSRAEAGGAGGPVWYGLHPRDWYYVPSPSDRGMPLRVDGIVTRVGPSPSLRLQMCENSAHGLYNSKRHAVGEQAELKGKTPFVTRFPPRLNQELRAKAAADQLGASDYHAASPISYLNGKPEPHEFRPPSDPEKMPPGAPQFVTTGRVWPRYEPVPPSALRESGDVPLRLAQTENLHPAARSSRSIKGRV